MSDPTGSTAHETTAPIPAPGPPSPTDLANAAALAAQRERRGRPPLPHHRGPKAPRPGRRTRRLLLWLLIVTLSAVVIFGGAEAWEYFSGTVGPLRSDQLQAVDVLATAGDSPRWAHEGQMRCAAEHLVHTQGLPTLTQAGVLTGSRGDYSYSGRWPSGLAVRWYQAVLGCAGPRSSAWAPQITAAWSLTDGGCLERLGGERVAAVLATGVAVTDDGLRRRNASTVAHLDACYAHEPAAPTAAATSGYREVGLVLTRPAVANGTAQLQVGSADPTAETRTSMTFRLPVDRGGAQACVSARTQVAYAWGTSRLGAPARLCGRAAPARISWAKVAHPCRKGVKACGFVALSVEGLAARQTAVVTYRMSGDFLCPKRKRTCKVKVAADATGRVRAPMIEVTGKRKGHVVAQLGALRATYPQS